MLSKTLVKFIFKNKLNLAVVSAFILSLIWLSLVIWYKVIPHKEPEVHYHAGFIVVENNQLVDFSDTKYMKVEPCTDAEGEDEHKSEQELQMEKAHLHGNVGDVVHTESDDGKWKDLFSNINYPINYSDTTAYINGEQVMGFQERSIGPYQSLVVFIGKDNDIEKFLDQSVTKEHIKEEENESEDCSTH